MNNSDQEAIQRRLQAVNDALDTGAYARVKRLQQQLSASDFADLMESSPPKARALLWNTLAPEERGEVLEALTDEVRNQFALEMEPEQLAEALSGLDTDDLADILGDLPDRISDKVLFSMDAQDQQRVKQALSYPEDTAGGLMNTDTITVRPDVTVDVVLRYLRLHENLPVNTNNLYVVNRDDLFIGVVSLQQLVTTNPEELVSEVLEERSDRIDADTPDNEVAQIFERYDLLSAPVVSEDGRLLGRITIDDVVDVIIEDSNQSLMGLGRLTDDEDTFAPVMVSTRRRSVWLGINLITAVLAAAVSNHFEGILEKLATVAILMTIVPSMGGIAGTQTLTLMVRAIAMGQIGESNSRWLLFKELSVGLLNGLLWAIVIATLVGFWKDDFQLGLIIAVAMAVNLSVAGLAGVAIPLILKRMDIDPALAGGVILTTITDVVGLIAFLGLATIILG